MGKSDYFELNFLKYTHAGSQSIYLVVKWGDEFLSQVSWLVLAFPAPWDTFLEEIFTGDFPTTLSTDFSLELEIFDQECIGKDDDSWAANDHFLSTFWLQFTSFELLREGKFFWNHSSNEISTASSTIVRKCVWSFALHSMKALRKRNHKPAIKTKRKLAKNNLRYFVCHVLH